MALISGLLLLGRKITASKEPAESPQDETQREHALFRDPQWCEAPGEPPLPPDLARIQEAARETAIAYDEHFGLWGSSWEDFMSLHLHEAQDHLDE